MNGHESINIQSARFDDVKASFGLLRTIYICPRHSFKNKKKNRRYQKHKKFYKVFLKHRLEGGDEYHSV